MKSPRRESLYVIHLLSFLKTAFLFLRFNFRRERERELHSRSRRTYSNILWVRLGQLHYSSGNNVHARGCASWTEAATVIRCRAFTGQCHTGGSPVLHRWIGVAGAEGSRNERSRGPGGVAHGLGDSGRHATPFFKNGVAWRMDWTDLRRACSRHAARVVC